MPGTGIHDGLDVWLVDRGALRKLSGRSTGQLAFSIVFLADVNKAVTDGVATAKKKNELFDATLYKGDVVDFPDVRDLDHPLDRATGRLQRRPATSP